MATKPTARFAVIHLPTCARYGLVQTVGGTATSSARRADKSKRRRSAYGGSNDAMLAMPSAVRTRTTLGTYPVRLAEVSLLLRAVLLGALREAELRRPDAGGACLSLSALAAFSSPMMAYETDRLRWCGCDSR